MQKAKHILSFLLAFAMIATFISPAEAAGPTGGWRSGISCQNLEGADAAVTLTFYKEGSSTEAIHYDATIDENGSKNWLTTSSVSMKDFPTNFIGAAVISSSTQLACNLNTESTNVGTPSSPYRMGTASGFNDAQTGDTMYIPQVINGPSGYSSYIAVQNTSTSDVNVTVRYFNADGSQVNAATENGLVKGQSTKVFYTNENAGLPSGTSGFNGGAVVSSDDGTTKLAVLVALYKGGATYGTAQFQSYNGVSSGSYKIFVPRFVRKMAGNNSGLTIQNLGAPTHVKVVFSFNGKEYKVVSSAPIATNASWLLYAPSNVTLRVLSEVDTFPDGDARQGSAIVTAVTDATGNTENTGASLTANVNEDNNVSGNTRYGQGATYNAINEGSQSETVFFPQFTKAVGNTFWSGFQVSNTTDQATTCSIEYINQPAINEPSVTLPANGSISRWAKSASSSQMSMRLMNAGYNAAVKVTCGQPVTGIVNLGAYGNKYGDSFEMTGGLNQ